MTERNPSLSDAPNPGRLVAGTGPGVAGSGVADDGAAAPAGPGAAVPAQAGAADAGPIDAGAADTGAAVTGAKGTGPESTGGPAGSGAEGAGLAGAGSAGGDPAGTGPAGTGSEDTGWEAEAGEFVGPPLIGVTPRDPEEAQRALVEIQDLLRHYAAVREAARNEAQTAGADRADIVARLSEAQYLSHLRARAERLHPADVAYVLEALPLEERLLVWDSVKAEVDGEVLLEVSEPVRDSLLDAMTRAEQVAAVKDLDADELADLAEHLDPGAIEEIQRTLTPEEREQLRAAMSYPEDSVGARMDFDLVSVREDVSLEVVLRYLRRFDALPGHTDQVFVVDRFDYLKGTLPIDQLLINEPDAMVSEVMRREVMSLRALDDAGEAAQAFERYDLVSAPVTDPQGRLIGRLTIDEVVDVIREEGEAEVLSQAGLREDEDLFASIWHSARNRWLWLAVNLVTAFIASRVIGLFGDTIERVVALAALMPIVAGMAGNSGNQTMTLVIRSLALGQVTGANFRRVVRKELAIAVLNGLVWGSVAGGFAWLLYEDTGYGMLLGGTMMAAIVLNLLIAALIGACVPFLLEKAGRDPAIGSSVLLTFLTDSLGFLLFLGIASLLF